ncbi:MAG TPA: ankyrin repeat domain-containing protein [Myxococcota bacterium]
MRAFGLFAIVVVSLTLAGVGSPGEPLAPAPFTLEQRFLEAARQGDLATLEKALARGVPIQSRDDLGRNALLLAARDAGSLEVVRFLRAKGVAVDAPDLGGRAAISWAAGEGRIAIVRELAGAGAQIDRRDVDGRTPCFQAVLGDHREVVVFLLDAGADVNAADRFRDTPLMQACAKGFDAMAALLLQRGADPALKDQEGRTARDRAAKGADACLGPRSL